MAQVLGPKQVVVFASLLAMLSITGCSKPAFIAQVETGPQGEVLLVNPFSKGQTEMQAGIVGALTVSPSRCVEAVDGNGNRWAVLLPQGASFQDSDPLSIKVSGRVLEIGSQATFGGGMVEGERNVTLLRDVPEPCRSDQTFQIQNIEPAP
jgi:hypothetical protein